MTQDNDTSKTAGEQDITEALTVEQINEALRAQVESQQRTISSMAGQVLSERAKRRDLEQAIDDRATRDAEIDEQNNAMLTVVLDNVIRSVSARLRELQANDVMHTRKAHVGITCDLFGGVNEGEPSDLLAFQEFLVRNMARRRSSGVPGTNAVGL